MKPDTIALYFIAAFIFFLIVLYILCLGQTLRALLTGIKITPTQIIFMKLRRTDVDLLIRNMAKSLKGGMSVTIHEIEAHMLAGGDINNVIDGLLFAKAHGISLTFREAANIDMRRHDVVSHVKANMMVS